jgi:serine/threonine-protein kinase
VTDDDDLTQQLGGPDTVWRSDHEATRPVDIRGVLDMNEDRYTSQRSLGIGGMGKVSLCKDRRIGRDVAHKVVRADVATPAARRAFLAEARVQAQLEHPAIVPVYDIGLDENGVEYFTMRAIAGITLLDVLNRLRAGDAVIGQMFSRLKLLDAFRQVCLAVDYAHAKGVVHRDLKPANVMLGEFGEVYILDWGAAKVVGADELAVAVPDATPALGTPGYVAPEQVVIGGVVDRGADIYALGAILFEILTLQRLHRGSPTDIVQSTTRGADARARARAPERDVSPELEEVCVKATMLAAGDRFASVRELHDAIAGFLDGRRNVALRRELANRHSAEATAEAEHALALGPDAEAHRRRALQELARALALDPDDRDARKTLLRLIAEPPREPPADVIAEIDAANDDEGKFAAKLGALGYASFIGVAALAFPSGLRSPIGLAIVVAAVVVAAVWCTKLTRRFNAWEGFAVFLVASVAVVVSTGFYGPLMIVPALAAANTMAFVFATVRPYRKPILIIGCLVMVGPAFAEWAGLIRQTYTFVDGHIVIVPWFVEFPETVVRSSLILVNLATLLIPSIILWKIADTKDDLRRRLVVQTWQMRQLVSD